MTHAHRAGFSRRNLLAASLAGVAVGKARTGDALASGVVADVTQALSSGDPVLGLCAQWTARRQSLEELIFEWQRLEQLVMTRAKKLGLDMDEAVGTRFPEAITMAMINREMLAAYDNLDDLTGRARGLTATSGEGALAKIGLGLRVQGPYNWEPNARELVESGVSELREICSR